MSRLSPEALADALGLILVTDPRLGRPRPVADTVRMALDGGCRGVQLRDKTASARELLHQARVLRELTREYGALLFVNDRVDVALASGADGVHLGPDDLPVEAARRWAGPDLLIGASTDDPDRARRLVADGADYIGCGAVFGTTTKDVGSEAIGPAGVQAVAKAVSVPVVGIGGIHEANAHAIAGTGAAGVAVVSAVMAAPDPGAAAAALLAAFDRGKAP